MIEAALTSLSAPHQLQLFPTVQTHLADSLPSFVGSSYPRQGYSWIRLRSFCLRPSSSSSSSNGGTHLHHLLERSPHPHSARRSLHHGCCALILADCQWIGPSTGSVRCAVKRLQTLLRFRLDTYFATGVRTTRWSGMDDALSHCCRQVCGNFGRCSCDCSVVYCDSKNSVFRDCCCDERASDERAMWLVQWFCFLITL